MSDSDEDEEVSDKKLKKLEKQLALKDKKKKSDKEQGSDEEELEEETKEGKKGINKPHLKKQIEEQKAKEEQKKKSMFLGESHGHFKLGTFVRIELNVDKKYSR